MQIYFTKQNYRFYFSLLLLLAVTLQKAQSRLWLAVNFKTHLNSTQNARLHIHPPLNFNVVSLFIAKYGRREWLIKSRVVNNQGLWTWSASFSTKTAWSEFPIFTLETSSRDPVPRVWYCLLPCDDLRSRSRLQKTHFVIDDTASCNVNVNERFNTPHC